MKNSFARVFKGFSDIVPLGLRKKIFLTLEFAGISEEPRVFLGKKVFLSVLGFFLGFFVCLFFSPIFLSEFFLNFFLVLSIAVGIFFALVLATIFYLQIEFRVEKRTVESEKFLPDFLTLVSSNINAGMTPFSAFNLSARKEFGTLSKEIHAAFSKSFESQSFSVIFADLTKKIKSRALEETLTIFVQAQHSGGKMVKLLDKLSEHFRKKSELKKEIVSSTQMYVLFVFFVILVATPILLAVSVQFLKMVTQIQEQNQFSSQSIQSIGFFSSELSISVEFMQLVAFLLLFFNSIFSSVFIGLLQTGKAMRGIRMFPVLFLASAIVFLVGSFVVEGFLGSWF